MPERKEFTVGMLIFLLITQRLLPLVQFGPTLQDPEYDQALAWATQQHLPDSDETTHYPFSTVNRLQAARWFVWFADLHQFTNKKQPSECLFTDLPQLPKIDQDTLTKSCLLGFFKGFKGAFVPYDPMTKASTTVVVARIISPDKSFPDVKEFRTPYLLEAVRLGILKQPSHPYLMYPISRYELLLMLWRTNTLLMEDL